MLGKTVLCNNEGEQWYVWCVVILVDYEEIRVVNDLDGCWFHIEEKCK